MYISKLQIVFVHIVKCICQNYKMSDPSDFFSSDPWPPMNDADCYMLKLCITDSLTTVTSREESASKTTLSGNKMVPHQQDRLAPFERKFQISVTFSGILQMNICVGVICPVCWSLVILLMQYLQWRVLSTIWSLTLGSSSWGELIEPGKIH